MDATQYSETKATQPDAKVRLGLGLGSQEARELSKLYGPNTLPSSKTPVLAVTTGVWAVGASVISLIVCTTVALHWQHWIFAMPVLGFALGQASARWSKAAKLRTLESAVPSHTQAVRDEALRQIATADLVPGDVFCVLAGQSVPCDAVVVWAGTDASTSTSSLVQKGVPGFPWRSSSTELSSGDVVLRGDTLVQGTLIALAFATGAASGLVRWQHKPNDIESVCQYAWWALGNLIGQLAFAYVHHRFL